MIKTKVAKSVTMALAGAALTIGTISNASAHTMYNTFTTTSAGATDGWTHVDGAPLTKPGLQTGALQDWVGVANQPFGYVGSAHLNWAAMLHDKGDSLVISQADSQSRYGFAAEIDTGAGAWQDAGLTSSGDPTALGPTGWKHQTDIGLIKSMETQNVTLNLSTLGTVGGNFGITVFTGMDTNTGDYSHHGPWNNANIAFTADNPFGTNGLNYLTHSGNVDNVNGLTFTAQAGEVYSIYLGGAGVGNWKDNVEGYALNITTSAVPVPAAAWLLGSGLVGLIGFGRRKQAAAI